ncbi:SDR family NAD(P)-dependent oxidoreductase, partial [Acinetobacter baumannii]
RALVTGATRGVGAAVVDALTAQGVRVVATARSVPTETRDGVYWVAADVATLKGSVVVADAALATLGGIDIIVNVLGGSSAP